MEKISMPESLARSLSENINEMQYFDSLTTTEKTRYIEHYKNNYMQNNKNYAPRD